MTPGTRRIPADGSTGIPKAADATSTDRNDSGAVNPQPIIDPQSPIEVDPRWGGVLDCVMACQGDDCAWRPFECKLILGGAS